MSTPSLPNFPTRRSLNAKTARYQAAAAAHRRGEHTATVRGCKACRLAQEGRS